MSKARKPRQERHDDPRRRTWKQAAKDVSNAFKSAQTGSNIIMALDGHDIVITKGDHVTEILRLNDRSYDDGDLKRICDFLNENHQHGAKIRHRAPQI